MKIAFINTLYAPYVGGGAELVLKDLCEGLARRGHEVFVVTVGPERGVKSTIIEGVNIIRIPYRNVYFHFRPKKPASWKKILWHAFDVYNLGMRRQLMKVLDDIMPDVVCAHNIAGISVAAIAAVKSRGLPYVQVLHDQYFACIRSTMYKNERCKSPCTGCNIARIPHRALSSKVDMLVGVSEFITGKMLKLGLFKQVKSVHSLHNSKLEQPSLSGKEVGNDVVIGFIGTLARNKGIEVLISEFLQFNVDGKSQLVIAGRGEQGYQDFLVRQYSNPAITFLGYVDPEAFYSSVDVCVVPSTWEDTLPSVVFESLLRGVPVIGSNRGGIPEMIVEGQNGMLFEPDAIGQLADRLSDFKEHRLTWHGRRVGIAQGASHYAEPDQWITRWESLLDEAVRNLHVNESQPN